MFENIKRYCPFRKAFQILYNKTMKNVIYIASANLNKELVPSLAKGGFVIEFANNSINDEDLYFLDLTDVSLEKLNETFPWLETELKHSKTPHLRILPLFVYDSRKTDPFEEWEKGANEIYEELFSEEFKPFAYDISNPEYSNNELKRVLSLYYVR